MRRIRSVLFLIVLFFMVRYVHAQGGFSLYNGRNHPELKWQVIETEHVKIIYHQRLENTAREAAAVAEACYGPITQNLGCKPKGKIPIYISDQDDITNGFDVVDKYIAVWVNVNDYIGWTTGKDKWLRTVIGHEMVHYIHMSAINTWLGIAGTGFSGTPGWFIEGLAQYESETWNVHRGDLLLRSAVIEDEMNYKSGKWTTNGRLMYAAGNSMVRYMADRYGDSTVVKLLHDRRRFLGIPYYSFGGAFAQVFPQTNYPDFYREWRRHVNIYYNTYYGQKEDIYDHAKKIKLPLIYTDGVQISPDKQWIAAVGVPDLDEPMSKLCLVKNDSTKKLKVLEHYFVNPHISFSPDGKHIAYSKFRRGRHGSLLSELYVTDLQGHKKRLTTDHGAVEPDWSPDGSQLVCVIEKDGTSNLYTLSPDGSGLKSLTTFAGDVQLKSPRWSPDGKHIAVTLNDERGNREIALVDPQTGEMRYFTTDLSDNRTPVWSPDGTRIAYTNYQTGTPDIFIKAINPGDDPPVQVTDSPAGLYGAAWDGDSLVCVLTDSRRKTNVVKIAADRAVLPAQLNIKPRYTSWLTHEPPGGIPPLQPDLKQPLSIQKQYRYAAVKKLQHYLTVPIPGRIEDHWGTYFLTAWAEPLGKHSLTGLGFLDFQQPGKSRYLLMYMNNTLAPSITATVFRLPGQGQIIDDKVLIEESKGGAVTMWLPFNFGDNLYSNHNLFLTGSWVRNDPYNVEEFKNSTIPVESRTVGVFRLSYTWKDQRPNYNIAIHPKQGMGLLLKADYSDRKWNSDLTFQKYTADAFINIALPVLGDVLYLRGKVQGANGRLLSQDFIGFDKYDQPDFGMGIKFSDRERLRGISRYMFGDRLWMTTAEYRIDLIENLGWQAAGITLERVTLAGFADIGSVWYNNLNSLSGAPVFKTYGVEIKNAVNLDGFIFAHEFGWAWLWNKDADPEMYYRIRAVAPF